MGCFAVGCITILVVGFIFIVGAAGTAWYVCTKAAEVLTTTEPADLKLVPPDQAQVRAAEGSLSRLKSAIATRQEATVGFTAADLNALINRDPDLEDMRGQIRIDIADSIMTVAVNVPLDRFHWRKVRGRWLNATTSFKFDYDAGLFDVDIKSLEANGREMSGSFLSAFNPSFSEAFTDKFRNEMQKNDMGEFWDRVKSIKLEDDKLVITTDKD